MGHFGCRTDCSEKFSEPLFAHANVNLIRRRPMNSLLAHSLGSATIIEFLMVFSLGSAAAFLYMQMYKSSGESENKRWCHDLSTTPSAKFSETNWKNKFTRG